MGGLARKLPVTYVVMACGALALAGIPPFSGYFSKDAILDAAFAANTGIGYYGWLCGVFTAGLTAFYIGRLFLLTFHTKSRVAPEVLSHVHESPAVMLGPLILLASGALLSGILLAPWFIGAHSATFWGSSIAVPPGGIMDQLEHPVFLAEWAPLAAGIAGFAVAAWFYILNPELPARLAKQFNGLYLFLLNKWYFDELYDAVLVRPTLSLAKLIWHVGDEQGIDGIPTMVATLTSDASVQTVKLQTGSIALYAFIMLVGLLGFLSLFLWIR
jgi:NADH-quinone oxidoreductase subunit L